MAGTLEGKTALVTGASRGIGRAIAEHFAAAGANVVGTYATNAAAAEATRAAIAAAGGRIVMLQADFATPGSESALADAVRAELVRATGKAGLDILVNNAGGGDYATVADTSAQIYDAVFNINTRATFFLTQALLPDLRSGGSVINFSSEAARLHLIQLPAYSMAKVAIENFTIALAKDVGPRNIRANAIRPGVIHTAQSDDFVSIPEQRKAVEDNTALRRIGQVDDIAGFVLAMVGPPGKFVTGQIIEISGGYLL